MYIMKVIILLLFVVSSIIIPSMAASFSAKQKVNNSSYLYSSGDLLYDKIGLYTFGNIYIEDLKDKNSDIAYKMYKSYLKTHGNKSCKWLYSKQLNKHIFSSKCSDKKENKKYVISSDNVIIDYVPRGLKKKYKNMLIENLSYESVCCYNRVCTYLTITFDNNKVLSPFVPNLDILMDKLNITSK